MPKRTRERRDPSNPPVGRHESAIRFLFGHDVFISYSRTDGAEYANALFSRLSDRAYAVFLDRQEGLYGDQLRARLKTLLARSKAMILVATPHAFESPHVQFELDTFAKVAAKRRPLIPIGTRALRDACPRGDIAERVWVEEPSAGELPRTPSDAAITSVEGRLLARKRVDLFRNVLMAACLIFLAIAIAAIWQWQTARVERDRAERRADEALAGKLIAESNQLFANMHSVPVSALLAIEAAFLLESAGSGTALQESNGALQQALRLLPEYLGGYSLGQARYTAARGSPSGDVFLLLQKDTARLWQIRDGNSYVDLDLQDRSWTSFSRDGRRLATVDRNRVRVWNVSDGRVVFETELQPCETIFAFRADGRALAMACADRINVVDVEARQQITTDAGAPVTALHFDTDGQLVSVAGTQLELRDGSNGERLRAFDLGVEPGDDFETAVDTAGKYFALLARRTMHLSERTSEIHVWSMKTGDKVAGFNEAASAGDLLFSPNGKYLAVLVAKGPHQTESRVNIAVYGVFENRLLMKGAHRATISTIAFSDDEKRVATASDDKTAIVWNIEDGRPLAVASHEDRVLAATFHDDLLHTFSNGIVDVWDTSAGEAVAEFRQHWRLPDQYDDIVRSIGFDRDGRFISYGPRDALFIRQKDGRIHTPDIPGRPGRTKLFFGAGRALGADVAEANTVSVVNLLTGKPTAYLPHHASPIVVAFAGDGRHLVTLAGTTLVRWNVDSGRDEGVVEAPAFEFRDDSSRASSAHHGHTLVVARSDRIMVVDFERQRTVTLAPQGRLASYELSSDGQHLAVLYARERQAILSVRESPRWTEKASQVIEASEPLGLSVRFFADAGKLALWGYADTFRVLDVPSLRETGPFRNAGIVRELDFSDDGSLLATGGIEGAMIWDLQKAAVVSHVRHDGVVNTVRFLPDRGYVLTGGDDRTARVWEWTRNREVWRAELGGDVARALVSPDGMYVATAVDSTIGEVVVQLRYWRTGDLIREGCARLRRPLSEREWGQYVGAGPVRNRCDQLLGETQPVRAGRGRSR